MVERCEQPRLPLESMLSLFTFQEISRQDLYRDVAIEARVSGSVDLPHSAHTEQAQDLVGAESSSGRQAHDFTMAIIERPDARAYFPAPSAPATSLWNLGFFRSGSKFGSIFSQPGER